MKAETTKEIVENSVGELIETPASSPKISSPSTPAKMLEMSDDLEIVESNSTLDWDISSSQLALPLNSVDSHSIGMQSIGPKLKPIHWSCDGIGNGKSSLDVVLDWLKIPGNYRRYHLKVNSKKSVCIQEIRNSLFQNGIFSRTETSIRHQLNRIHIQFRKAYQYQVFAPTSEEAKKSFIMRKWPIYHSLLDHVNPKLEFPDITAAEGIIFS